MGFENPANWRQRSFHLFSFSRVAPQHIDAKIHAHIAMDERAVLNGITVDRPTVRLDIHQAAFLGRRCHVVNDLLLRRLRHGSGRVTRRLALGRAVGLIG